MNQEKYIGMDVHAATISALTPAPCGVSRFEHYPGVPCK